ncbi:hypothetical protein PTSG_01573 [Salpingoeca rosetta]|uniref:Uncharacterized protein n=1 Tax=Salpingoeca rosetta (strain ATCC 50818 / BSB-021) TaxID=946362 RepID=F2U0R4_SALR5|nr:uncharacterized protein PTSG_01573 [Salpingoeca rosetta]EGD80992.1 hypothetical protein PTSG_01573 [Salpingoeca rosetta]|eukprot:XP_004997553.1 hypothetical protein PTSG_01573 [Salpingoeca rosetta]
MSTTDTTTLDELLQGGCKWISGVAADNGVFPATAFHATRHPSSSSIQPQCIPRPSQPRCVHVTLLHGDIHSHRSSDAFHPRKQAIPRHLQGHYQVCSFLMPCATTSPSCTTAGTLCWCVRAGGLAKSAWAVRGKVGDGPSCQQAEEEFNKYTRTELALETKIGLIIMAAGAIPIIVVDHYVLVRMDE